MATTAAPAAPQGGKGKKRNKGKTVNLQCFLADKDTAPEGFMMVSSKSWADAMEEEDEGDLKHSFDMCTSKDSSSGGKIILPTAPKSVRAPDIDLNSIPTTPPFKAYLGNLPYEVIEEDIVRFFKRLEVKEVQLPRDGERLRGFGYAEFPDRETLIEALGFNNEPLKNRPIRVSLSSGDGDRDHGDRPRRSGYDDGPDRTVGDWRSAPREDLPPRERTEQRGDRSDGMSRNGSGFNFRDNQDRREPFGGSSSFERRDDRRGDGGFDRAGGGGGFNRDRDYGSQREGSRYGDDYRPRSDINRDGDNRGGNRDFGSNFGRPEGRRDRDDGYRAAPPSSRSPPPDRMDDRRPQTERPKLQLQKRTKPIEEKTPVVTSAIFGGAKPVDTATKEREIEEKMRKQTLDDGKNGDSPIERGPERVRRMSNTSNVSGSGTNRSRRGSESERSRGGRSEADLSSKRSSESESTARDETEQHPRNTEQQNQPSSREEASRPYKPRQGGGGGGQESREYRPRNNRNYDDNYASYDNYPSRSGGGNRNFNSRNFNTGERNYEREQGPRREMTDSRGPQPSSMNPSNGASGRGARQDGYAGNTQDNYQGYTDNEKMFQDNRKDAQITSTNKFAHLNDDIGDETSD